ncbi:MAG: PLDc N-terminal domain-containing protein [Thermoanaerobaculia bacterium]|nr:PLDc N-terminal domain-containing protein [Thermoanaerobaculia bacterium]
MILFSVSLAFMFAFTALYSVFQYSRMVAVGFQGANEWLVKFLLFGPVSIPYFHVRVAPQLASAPRKEVLRRPADWVPITCPLAFFVDFGWTISLLGQRHPVLTETYLVMSTINSVFIWSTWVVCLYFLSRTRATPARKVAWGLGILALPFFIGPLHYFAYARQDQPT